MNRRNFLRTFFGAAIGITMTGMQCASRDRKPNIVLILADDLGWNQLGCYGSDFYETPNIDQLASQGMRFTDAYAACPVCSPTRASIMTGKYPARLHITDFIAGGDPPPNSPLLHPDWQKYLPLEEITIAEALKREGYTTASFGKWHLSQAKTPPESLPYNPDKQGFDASFVTYKPVDSMKKEWQTPENDAHNVHIITDKSLQFMEDNQDSPFFLYMPHNTIHTPVMEKESLIEKYRQKLENPALEKKAVIGAMVETLDHSVGKIMAKLEELGIADNTLLFFYSDNGGLNLDEREGFPTMEPLRGGKADLYEGGIRVPFIARWPGRIPAGTLSGELMSSIDLFPTFLSAVGITQQYDNIDGIDLLPILTESGSPQREAIYWHYPHYHGSGEGPSGAVRIGDYKLIEWYENSILDRGQQVELYNLKQDISEQNNLANTMPDKADELRLMLHAWRESVNAQMPPRNPDYEPA